MKRKEIIKELQELEDDKYKEFHKSLCPGTENIIGIRVPVLRNYAKQICKENDYKELLNILQDEFYEETMLRGMIIGLNTKLSVKEMEDYIVDFVPRINNWAVCDVFCAGLKITKKYEKEMWQIIQKYLKSNKEFELRFAIVMILDFYIKEDYLKEIFKICDSIKSDKYYVRMAVSWCISFCLIKFYDETIDYLNNCKLDDFTYQKSIQKAIESYRITTNQKDYLRKVKKR